VSKYSIFRCSELSGCFALNRFGVVGEKVVPSINMINEAGLLLVLDWHIMLAIKR
jgi:hypothetical protein